MIPSYYFIAFPTVPPKHCGLVLLSFIKLTTRIQSAFIGEISELSSSTHQCCSEFKRSTQQVSEKETDQQNNVIPSGLSRLIIWFSVSFVGFAFQVWKRHQCTKFNIKISIYSHDLKNTTKMIPVLQPLHNFNVIDHIYFKSTSQAKKTN